MFPGKLSALQARILSVLVDVKPRFTLSGGGALVATGVIERETRDLDLFWRGMHELGPIKTEVAQKLVNSGLAVSILQTTPALTRVRVSDGDATTMVDLVAEEIAAVDQPIVHQLGQGEILIDTPHEILVNKLCALLSRSELRDLQDTKALIESGEDLDRAVKDAPRKDSGFSALTLAWVLRSFPVKSLAAPAGLGREEAESLDEFRLLLVDRLIAPK